MAGGDWAGAGPITKVVGVGAEERTMSPSVAVHAVPVLVARSSEMPNLVTSVVAHPGLKVVGAIRTNVPSVTTHGAEVIHIDDHVIEHCLNWHLDSLQNNNSCSRRLRMLCTMHWCSLRSSSVAISMSSM